MILSSKYSGIAVKKCPDACTAARCVISTVAVCKHPLMSGANGCGPITMANRAEALKVLGITPKQQETTAG